MKPKMVKYCKLRLGDRIRLSADAPYMDATVKQIKDGIITALRVYVQDSERVYSSGLICTIGYEEVTMFQDSDREVMLLERRALREGV